MTVSQEIKHKAAELGFAYCGITEARYLPDYEKVLVNWLAQGFHSAMTYMERNQQLRLDPSKIIENGRSVICVARNYFPINTVSLSSLNVSKYAYGTDYHLVMKPKLQQLLRHVQQLLPGTRGRCFVDSAPLLEKALAVESGLGWIGKNSLLIIPRAGSFFFLGEVVVDVDLECDQKSSVNLCGRCTRCIDSCPTRAIVSPGVVDARRCSSCATIESKGIDEAIVRSNTYLFGCDICQDVCPWNSFATPHTEPDFAVCDFVKKISPAYFHEASNEQIDRDIKGTAFERAGSERLRQLASVLDKRKADC